MNQTTNIPGGERPDTLHEVWLCALSGDQRLFGPVHEAEAIVFAKAVESYYRGDYVMVREVEGA